MPGSNLLHDKYLSLWLASFWLTGDLVRTYGMLRTRDNQLHQSTLDHAGCCIDEDYFDSLVNIRQGFGTPQVSDDYARSGAVWQGCSPSLSYSLVKLNWSDFYKGDRRLEAPIMSLK